MDSQTSMRRTVSSWPIFFIHWRGNEHANQSEWWILNCVNTGEERFQKVGLGRVIPELQHHLEEVTSPSTENVCVCVCVCVSVCSSIQERKDSRRLGLVGSYHSYSIIWKRWSPHQLGMCVCVCVCVCAQLLTCVWPFSTPWTIACQAHLVHGISQVGILEWVAISSSSGSSQPWDRTWVSCIGRRVLYHRVAWEALINWEWSPWHGMVSWLPSGLSWGMRRGCLTTEFTAQSIQCHWDSFVKWSVSDRGQLIKWLPLALMKCGSW